MVMELEKVSRVKKELTRFLMSYKFALDELNTKVEILKQEFQYIHDYNPIEYVKSRVKTPESILKKVERKGLDYKLTAIRDNIRDIAGVRIVCSFISDIYHISEMLQNQSDLEVIEAKDYIKNPKANGYKSLHLIVRVPVFMSEGVKNVCVEIQIRTMAMDFWASIEHKLYYKYNYAVPTRLQEELKSAAETVSELDKKMEGLHDEIILLKHSDKPDNLQELSINDQKIHLPVDFLSLLMSANE